MAAVGQSYIYISRELEKTKKKTPQGSMPCAGIKFVCFIGIVIENDFSGGGVIHRSGSTLYGFCRFQISMTIATQKFQRSGL